MASSPTTQNEGPGPAASASSGSTPEMQNLGPQPGTTGVGCVCAFTEPPGATCVPLGEALT